MIFRIFLLASFLVAQSASAHICDDFLKQMPVQRTAEREIYNNWRELIIELDKTDFSKPSPYYVTLSTYGIHHTRAFRLQDHWVEGWRKLGLIRDGRWNHDVTIDQIAENFEKASGFRTTIPLRKHIPNDIFLHSLTFAEMIGVKRTLPLDDIHSILFHTADLIDPFKRRMFEIAERFILAEYAYQGHFKDGYGINISYNLVNELIEGYAPTEGHHLSGVLDIMFKENRSWQQKHSPLFYKWRLENYKSNPEELRALLLKDGISTIFPDNELHWYFALKIMEIFLPHWQLKIEKHPDWPEFAEQLRLFKDLRRDVIEERQAFEKKLGLSSKE
jgi:hypothetical protein